MATVTPNFNWPVPTSTDLVKDGATAIEALGDSIDGSLVDLKGGTTGQVLSKTSGTDMDFTWVTTDDANAIQNSIVDAKGDLISATANDTPARLAVGNNGETLVADSSTSTGLRYQEPKAGNPVLNSAMQIAQRGTSFTIAANTMTDTLDRWRTYVGNAGIVISQQLTGDTTNLPNIQYCVRMQRSNGQTGTSLVQLAQNFETINSIPFAGKTVTVSFYARKGANYSQASSQLGFSLYSGTGTDQNLLQNYTGAAQPVSGAALLTTTWQRFSYTGTISASATEIAPYFNWQPAGTAGAADYCEVTGVQIEVGSVATPFKTYAATIQGELAACQRYYRRFSAGGSASYLSQGSAISTTKASIIFNTGTMRITPTVLDYNAINVADGVGGAASTAASLVAATSTPDIAQVDFTVASGLTQYRPYFAQANGTTSYVGFSAEL